MQMDARLLQFVCVTLLITLGHVIAGAFESSPMDQGSNGGSQGRVCGSCLDASRKAERALRDLDLFGDLEMLSLGICNALPSDLKSNCLDKSGAYIDQAKSRLQALFHEVSLCKDTGLCLNGASVLPSKNAISKTDELEICVECRRAIKTIFDGVETTKTKRKVEAALFDYCEELEKNEKECKQHVVKFLPIVLNKLEDYQPNDLCRMMRKCRQQPPALI